MCASRNLAKKDKRMKNMGRINEQPLCKVTPSKATNTLWIKLITDLITLFGLNLLSGTGYMPKKEVGKTAWIAAVASWIFLIILYFDKKFSRRWLCIQRIPKNNFTEKNRYDKNK